MSKERYKVNRTRVFDIMGIDPKDRRYNCHHIEFRSDGGSDEKGNLFPLPIEDHNALHKRIQELENNIRNEKRRKNTTTSRKSKRGKRRRR